MSNSFPVDTHQKPYPFDQRQLLELSPSNKLVVDCIDNTVVITLDNPPTNTLDIELLKGLTTVIERLNHHTHAMNLIVTGRGDQYFSAGLDWANLVKGDLVMTQKAAKACQDAFKALANYRGVTIAAINGYVMGSGLECALACDIRICEQHAVMAMPELSLGLLPCGGATQSLTQKIGSGWAKRMLLCGEHITPNQALTIGLVEEVVESKRAFEHALKLAQKASQQSPSSIALAKQLIDSAHTHTFSDQLTQEHSHLLSLYGSQDQKEGASAFLEKRKPVWTND